VKVVFDTNVLIAAFLTEGLCSGLLIRARKQAFNLVLCDYIIQECEGILTKKFKLSSTDIATISDMVAEAAYEILHELHPIPCICPDTDDMIIACAGDATADYIVTGDEDLLIIKKYNDIQIINPRNFEALFED
jgi:putative PIN family toxin of toxin-antitoxin system